MKQKHTGWHLQPRAHNATCVSMCVQVALHNAKTEEVRCVCCADCCDCRCQQRLGAQQQDLLCDCKNCTAAQT
jgi:hypothetical protein